MNEHKDKNIDTNKPKFIDKYGVWILAIGMIAFLIVVKLLFNFFGM